MEVKDSDIVIRSFPGGRIVASNGQRYRYCIVLAPWLLFLLFFVIALYHAKGFPAQAVGISIGISWMLTMMTEGVIAGFFKKIPNGVLVDSRGNKIVEISWRYLDIVIILALFVWAIEFLLRAK